MVMIPLIYHPLILILIGIWGYTISLFFLDWQGIHVNSLVYTHPSNHLNQLEPFFILSVTLTWFILVHFILLENTLLVQYAILSDYFSPVVFCYSVCVCIVLWGPCAKEANRFLRCLYRLLVPLSYTRVYFSDILVADVLISFSSVLTLLFIQIISQIKSVSIHASIPPIITSMRITDAFSSLPYLIRLKQCCNDYSKGIPRNKRHLFNALKYTSSIPVIFLAQFKHHPIMGYLWLMLAVSTHVFAFGWELVMDWGLIQYNCGSIRWRKDGWFSDMRWYLAASVINLNIRMIKLMASVYPIHAFYIDLFEIIRRWIWVIFRFEYEHVKSSFSKSSQT
ncbi:Protein SYG1 [Choanephora cucurbitarum]|uniref:Protein SYG1 n=1 Tax=Choanephora cucurbitarum TaxID=101091 RepID=A0A1C7N0H5_9FUNG|nr:Protein SYG1 [Choanephora cucurbitarum]